MTEPNFPDELVIPLRRLRLFGSFAGYSLLFLGLAATGAGGLARTELTSVTETLSALAPALLAVGAGYLAHRELRKLSSRGLVLNARGFEFNGHQWRWRELSQIDTETEESTFNYSRTIILVSMRPEYANSGHRVDTSIDVANFQTGGEPLDRILRRWLKRYGTP